MMKVEEEIALRKVVQETVERLSLKYNVPPPSIIWQERKILRAAYHEPLRTISLAKAYWISRYRKSPEKTIKLLKYVATHEFFHHLRNMERLIPGRPKPAIKLLEEYAVHRLALAETGLSEDEWELLERELER